MLKSLLGLKAGWVLLCCVYLLGCGGKSMLLYRTLPDNLISADPKEFFQYLTSLPLMDPESPASTFPINLLTLDCEDIKIHPTQETTLVALATTLRSEDMEQAVLILPRKIGAARIGSEDLTLYYAIPLMLYLSVKDSVEAEAFLTQDTWELIYYLGIPLLENNLVGLTSQGKFLSTHLKDYPTNRSTMVAHLKKMLPHALSQKIEFEMILAQPEVENWLRSLAIVPERIQFLLQWVLNVSPQDSARPNSELTFRLSQDLCKPEIQVIQPLPEATPKSQILPQPVPLPPSSSLPPEKTCKNFAPPDYVRAYPISNGIAPPAVIGDLMYIRTNHPIISTFTVTRSTGHVVDEGGKYILSTDINDITVSDKALQVPLTDSTWRLYVGTDQTLSIFCESDNHSYLYKKPKPQQAETACASPITPPPPGVESLCKNFPPKDFTRAKPEAYGITPIPIVINDLTQGSWMNHPATATFKVVNSDGEVQDRSENPILTTTTSGLDIPEELQLPLHDWTWMLFVTDAPRMLYIFCEIDNRSYLFEQTTPGPIVCGTPPAPPPGPGGDGNPAPSPSPRVEPPPPAPSPSPRDDGGSACHNPPPTDKPWVKITTPRATFRLGAEATFPFSVGNIPFPTFHPSNPMGLFRIKTETGEVTDSYGNPILEKPTPPNSESYSYGTWFLEQGRDASLNMQDVYHLFCDPATGKSYFYRS